MIFVFHGDNQPALRNDFLRLKKGYDESRFWSEELADIPSYLAAPSLFGKKELVILEDPLLGEAVSLAGELGRQSLAGSGGFPARDVIFLFRRRLNQGELGRFKGVQIRDFRDDLPKNVFPLLDALLARRKSRALLEARRLLREGHSADYLLKMINWQFRNLARLKSGAVKGINPYVVKKLRRFERNWRDADLRRAFSLILREDLRRKRGKKRPFDFLIDRLMGKIRS